MLEAQPRACRVDLDAAPSASALPAHAGMAGALANGVAAANVWPFPRGVATFVRPGSGRIEPIARPAAPANTNTVILRTTSPAQLMAGYDSRARDLKDRSKRLTNNYGMRRYKIKLLYKAIVSHDPSNATDRSRDVAICVERARHSIRRTVSLATFKRMKPMRSKVHRYYAEAHEARIVRGNSNMSAINVCITALNLTQPCELGDARIKRAVRQAPHVHITKRRAATKHHPPRVIQPSSNVANVHRQAHYHACVRKKQFASQYRHATSRRCNYKTRSLNPSLLVPRFAAIALANWKSRAIDPKRSIRVSAAPPIKPSDMASPLRAAGRQPRSRAKTLRRSRGHRTFACHSSIWRCDSAFLLPQGNRCWLIGSIDDRIWPQRCLCQIPLKVNRPIPFPA